MAELPQSFGGAQLRGLSDSGHSGVIPSIHEEVWPLATFISAEVLAPRRWTGVELREFLWRTNLAMHLRTSARPPGLATTVHLRTGHNSTRQARGEEIGAEIGELRGGDAQGREWLVR